MEGGAGNAFKKALIEEVKKHPVLFDGHRRDYKNPVVSAEAWGKVAAALNSSPMECETAFQGLRNRFTHERKRRLRAAQQPSLTHGNPWHLYDDIKWLGDYVKMRDRRPGALRGDEMEPLPTQAAYFPDSLLHLGLGKGSEDPSPTDLKDEAASDDGSNSLLQGTGDDGPLGLNPAAISSLLGLTMGGLGAAEGRGQKRGSDTEALVDEVKRTREELADEEALFGRVVAKALARLPPIPRAQAKVDIQKLLLHAEMDAAHKDSHPQ